VDKYLSNGATVAKARKLIDARQYVRDSDRGEVRSHADAQNAYLESHSWDGYGEWHLRLTEGAADHTKARYAFVYGDFRRLHSIGPIACIYRAAEWLQGPSWPMQTGSFKRQPQHLRDVGGRDPLVPEAARLRSVGVVDLAWTSALASVGCRSRGSGAGPLDHGVAFELSEGAIRLAAHQSDP
jgi:hypothetical protein